jgi:hypothetical protein
MNDKLRTGSRLEENGLFHEPVEELPPVPGRSAVEAECELDMKYYMLGALDSSA